LMKVLAGKAGAGFLSIVLGKNFRSRSART
jgi:hypothetical protein